MRMSIEERFILIKEEFEKPIDKLFKQSIKDTIEYRCVYCEKMIASGGPYYYCIISEDKKWAKNPCLVKDWMMCPFNNRREKKI